MTLDTSLPRGSSNPLNDAVSGFVHPDAVRIIDLRLLNPFCTYPTCAVVRYIN